MGKALVIKTADFTNIAVSMSKIVVDKSFTNAQLVAGSETGFCDSRTGKVRTDVGGYTYKVVTVDGYSSIIVSGWYPIHIGAFYSSATEIGESTYVSCDGGLTKSGTGDITKTVSVPTGAVAVSINLNSSYDNHTLECKTS